MLFSIQSAVRDASFLGKVLLALVPLCGVVGAALASLSIAGRKLYVDSITIERSKWIDKLRSNLSTYSAELLTYGLQTRLNATESTKARSFIFAKKPASKFEDSQLIESFKRIEELSAIICLQLNPRNAPDATILFLIQNCGLYFANELKELNRFNRLVMQHAQWLLKAEWEKVKWEAGGIGYKLMHARDAKRRERDYRKFLNGEGEVTALASMAISYKTQKDMGLNWITEEEYDKWIANVKQPAPKQSWIRRKSAEITNRRIQARVREAGIKAGLDLGDSPPSVQAS